MSTIRLAGNLIANSEGRANWGHLQIVNAAMGTEIEVQSWINRNQDDPFEFPNFLFREEQNHSANTDFAPGSANADPDNYAEVSLDVGTRDSTEVWDLLVRISDVFVQQSPNYFYGLGQNSNSYAATLLWMIGIDVNTYLAAATPASVSGMTEEAADEEFDTGWSPDVLDPFPGADRNLLLNGYNGFLGSPIIDFIDINLTSGNDIFRTGHGDDRIFGNAGDDTIEANGGSDTLAGGSGAGQLAKMMNQICIAGLCRVSPRRWPSARRRASTARKWSR